MNAQSIQNITIIIPIRTVTFGTSTENDWISMSWIRVMSLITREIRSPVRWPAWKRSDWRCSRANSVSRRSATIRIPLESIRNEPRYVKSAFSRAATAAFSSAVWLRSPTSGRSSGCSRSTLSTITFSGHGCASTSAELASVKNAPPARRPR